MKVGIFGVGRIGRVHAQILLSQGQEIVCIGDDSLACCQEALKVIGLDEKNVKVFGSAEWRAAVCQSSLSSRRTPKIIRATVCRLSKPTSRCTWRNHSQPISRKRLISQRALATRVN